MATIKGVWHVTKFDYLGNYGLRNNRQDVNFTVNGSRTYNRIGQVSTTSGDTFIWMYYLSGTNYFPGGINYNIGVTLDLTFDFGDTEQDVADGFLAWISKYGEQVDITKATITYNGIIIAELAEGQTATLQCGGKKAGGEIVAQNADGETTTIAVKGQIMASDIVVEAKAETT